MKRKSVKFPGESEEREEVKWDKPEQLEAFLSRNMKGLNEDKAKEISPLLLTGGYTTKTLLLNARREGLKDAGILMPALIDAILNWTHGQQEEPNNGKFSAEENFVVVVVLDGFDSNVEEFSSMFHAFLSCDFPLGQWLFRALLSVPGSSSDGNDYKTPLPPLKKKHKASSPGAVIDNTDADDKDFLATVVAAIFDDQRITVPEDPSRLPKALGFFSKIHLVHTAGQIDGRFRTRPTHVGQQLIQHLTDEGKDRTNVILLGKSGVGKTTAIFDAAKSMYCVFFSASQHKIDMPKRDPGQFDASFSTMVSELAGVLQDIEKCNHIIEAMVLARFLVMHKFRKLRGATPAKWMQYQLTTDMHNATLGVFRLLEKYERKKKVKVLGEKVRKAFEDDNCPWFFAYDECQYGYEILQGKCDAGISTTTNKTRGVSCPFLRIVGDIGRVVIAGTALSVETADSCISGAGRLGTELYTDFPSVNIEQVHSELNATLNLTGINLDKVPLWLLEGRGRLLGDLLPFLAEEVKERPLADKQTLLISAIEKHYGGFLNNIVQKTMRSFKLGKDKHGNGRLSKHAVLPPSLEILALASLWGGYIGIGKDNIDVDLLDIGLCSVRVEGESSEKVYVLDEELGKRAILEVAKRYDYSNTSFAKALQLSPETKSHAMEPVLVAELARWSQEHSGSATVRKFLETLFDDLPQNLPGWIDDAIFNVKTSRKSKGKEDIEFIAGALNTDGDSRGVLLSPSTIKRPDFEAFMGRDDCDKTNESNCSPWFLAVSSKLYQKIYDDKFGEDLRSTDPRKGFYHKKNGEANPHCSRLLKDWENLLNDNDEVFGRCLRLHVCLPDVKPVLRKGRNERIWVEDDKSIVAYITQENVRKIFSGRAVSILEHLKVVNLASVDYEDYYVGRGIAQSTRRGPL